MLTVMRRLAIVLLVPLLGLSAPAAAMPSDAPATSAARAGAERPQLPALRVTRAVTGLQQPWDVQALGRGRLLITERETRRLLLSEDGATRRVSFPRNSVWVSGETGLMSLAVDPAFDRNRRFYTCQGGTKSGGAHDVRVLSWRLNKTSTRAVRRGVLVKGLPATSGRHGGCRLLIVRSGALLVGTGDAAVGTNAQNRNSLGGKVLRLDRRTGKPWPGNPWAGSTQRNRRYLLTYGHRNVQGLAQRSDGSLWSVEHGSYRDDEVNRLVKGGNYGWNPVPGYNESVPMTDHSLSGRQIDARWRSGTPTIATSGAAWVRGKKWGRLNGTLAVAALAGERLVFMRFNKSGRLKWTTAPQRMRTFGRLRSVTRAANGDLVVTTANGTNDAVLRVAPR